MFDNLREESEATPFYEAEEKFKPADDLDAPPARQSKRFLGMTAPQRFIIALLILFAVFSLGAMCLLITNKISLP